LYTFNAIAGQNLGLGLGDLVISPDTERQANMTAYHPSGSVLVSTQCATYYGGCKLNMNNLAAGTYSVVVSMERAAIGSFKLYANTESTGTLAVNAAANVSLKTGQSARYTFSGVSGQSVSIELTQLVTVPPVTSGGILSVYVYRPTDSVALSGYSFVGQWQYVTIFGAGGTLALPPLPATGTYTVIVDDWPYGMSANFALKARSP
jgi:large repetitive protein